MNAVSNTGLIIHLSWIGRLELLHTLFDTVFVPLAVRDELLRAGSGVPGVADIHDAFAAGWLTVLPVCDLTAITHLMTELDRGESEAFALMSEIKADILLLDERRARSHELRQGLSITGSIGILQLARSRRLIPAVIPLLEELWLRGFLVSGELMERIRREATVLGQG